MNFINLKKKKIFFSVIEWRSSGERMPGGAVHAPVPVFSDDQRRSKTRSFRPLLRLPARILGLPPLDSAILPRTLGLPHDHHFGAELQRRVQLLVCGHFRPASAPQLRAQTAGRQRGNPLDHAHIILTSTNRLLDLETRTAGI